MAKHLGSGRWHLSLASAHRGLARCAVGVEPRLWSVVVDTLSEQSRFLVYRPSCVPAYTTCYQIGSLHASHFVRPRTAVLMRAVPVGRAEPLA